MKEKINLLSPLTWRWLHVNYDEVEIGLQPPVAEVDVRRISGGGLLAMNPLIIKETEPFFENMDTGVGKSWLEEHFQELTGGYLIEPDGTDDLVHLTFSARKGHLVDHNVIRAKEGQHIRVMMEYLSPISYHGGVTRILAGKNAQVELVKVYRAGGSTQEVDLITAHAEEGARIRVLSAAAGGAHGAFNIHMDLKGKGARGEIETAYIGSGNEKLDFSYRINHQAPETTSDIVANGVLAGTAKKTFRGVLDFQRGSKGSKGAEVESVTLLNKGVRSQAVPVLLCQEDDVEGAHAASAGRLDEDMLFYIMSRGIPEGEARKLLVRAKLSPTLDQIPDESVREILFAHLDQRINKTGGGE